MMAAVTMTMRTRARPPAPSRQPARAPDSGRGARPSSRASSSASPGLGMWSHLDERSGQEVVAIARPHPNCSLRERSGWEVVAAARPHPNCSLRERSGWEVVAEARPHPNCSSRFLESLTHQHGEPTAQRRERRGEPTVRRREVKELTPRRLATSPRPAVRHAQRLVLPGVALLLDLAALLAPGPPAVTSRCLRSLDALTPDAMTRQADDNAPAR